MFAETLIEKISGRETLSARDRSFLNAVVLGVLRNLTLLDHHLGQLRDGRIRPQTRWIMRLGIYQILEMRIPDHAAVSETVVLARSRGERNLVNAVLRRATREAGALRAQEASLPLPVRYSLPEFLVRRWATRFGETETAALCRWINLPASVWIRKNGLRPDAVAAAIASSPDASPHPADSRFLTISSLPTTWIESGAGYIQDPSTAAACDLLHAAPGETVLDACAAPGGKTGLLAEAMQNRGQLLATDADEYRLIRLLENLARLGADNTNVARIDWSAPDPENNDRYRNQFDATLVDAPCTNTGVMRRRVDVRWRLREADFAGMARTQLAILANCANSLKPGGRIVYSTCSLETEENEGVVERFLAARPDFRLEKSVHRLPFRDQVDGCYCGLLISAA